jgi:hypothetical protein
VCAKISLLHNCIRPDKIEKLSGGNHLPCAIGQRDKKIESATADRDWCTIVEERSFGTHQTVGPKINDFTSTRYVAISHDGFPTVAMLKPSPLSFLHIFAIFNKAVSIRSLLSRPRCQSFLRDREVRLRAARSRGFERGFPIHLIVSTR